MSATPAAKRRRIDKVTAADKSADVNILCAEILDALRAEKARDGTLLVEPFLKAPSRRTTPEYYKDIENPIDITRIQQKLKNEDYKTVDDFSAEMQLLVDNTTKFYGTMSGEASAATEMLQVFEQLKEKFVLDDGASCRKSREVSASPAPSVRSLSPGRSTRSKDSPVCEPVEVCVMQELLCSVMEYGDETGRLLCPPFRLLPSKESNPEYYEKVTDAIDLKTIAIRIQDGHYKSLQDIERDMALLVRNAKLFNGNQSSMHKDAVMLHKYARQRIKKLIDSEGSGVVDDRQEKNSVMLSELMAQEEGEDDVPDQLSEDSSEDEATEGTHDQYWLLYWAVRNHTAAQDFCQLPSRKWYPDYYDEIKEPMSLYMINKRIKRSQYKTLQELVTDLILLLDNARTYNIEGSDIYDASVKLQQLVAKTVSGMDSTISVPFVTSSSEEGEGETEGDMVSDDTPCPSPATPAQGNSPASSSMQTPSRAKTPREQCNFTDPSAKGKPGRKTMDELQERYRAKLMLIWENVVQETAPDGRKMSELFLELPSKTEYPDYYEHIAQPVSLNTIRRKIENDEYHDTSTLMADLVLMFENAQSYNEDGSQVYTDADKLLDLCRRSVNGVGQLQSPKYLREKFGWQRTRAPGGPRVVMKNRPAAGFDPLEPVMLPPPKSKLHAISSSGSLNKPQQKRPVKKLVKDKSFPEQDANELTTMFDAIKTAEDARGRLLFRTFWQLPSKEEIPDYYDVIKKPMDLERIQAKLIANSYANVDQLVSDLLLMFDNACRYNEPDSYIYKDALALQKVLIEQKQASLPEDSVCDVHVSVQALLTRLFLALYTHTDSDGRSYTDSFAELEDLVRAVEGDQATVLTFDTIKRNLDKERYRRLDRLQEDLFSVFDKARQVARSDSQLFDDSVELQLYYVEQRDQMCRLGQILCSPALSVRETHVNQMVNEAREARKQLEKDMNEGVDPNRDVAKPKDTDEQLKTVTVGDVCYEVGAFALVAPSDPAITQPHVVRIERIWKDRTMGGDTFIRGNWFYRPTETTHRATRKFIPQEVFQSVCCDTIVASRLQAKCCVLFIADFIKFKPKNFDDQLVFVCESKYHGKPIYFKKMKSWPFRNEQYELEERKDALRLQRVPSQFKEDMSLDVDMAEPMDTQSDTNTKSSALDDSICSVISAVIGEVNQDNSILHKDRQQVQLGVSDGRMCLEQTCHNGHWLLLGDGLYVGDNKDTALIYRIDRIWIDTSNQQLFVSGPRFVRPVEIEHEPSRMFLERELFAVDQQDSIVNLSINKVLGSCALLTLKDIQMYRPTEVPESDVYVVQGKVPGFPNDVRTGLPCSLQQTQPAQGHTDGEGTMASPPPPSSTEPMNEQSVRKLSKLKPYKLNEQSLPHEYFYFPKPIMPQKVASPLLMSTDTTVDVRELLPEQVTGEQDVDEMGLSLQLAADEFAHMSKEDKERQEWLATQPKINSRSRSGYILFSAEVRKKIMTDNPQTGFGDISRIVGQDWKKLSESRKKYFEERAMLIAKEREKADKVAPPQSKGLPGQVLVYTCKWHNCDFMFEDANLLHDHVNMTHTSEIRYPAVDGGECDQYVCMWTSCTKYRKQGKPFPSLPRLHRHLKEKHLHSSWKFIYPNARSRNYVSAAPRPPSTPGQSSSQGSLNMPQQQVHAQPQGQGQGQMQFGTAGTQYTQANNQHLVYQQQQAVQQQQYAQPAQHVQTAVQGANQVQTVPTSAVLEPSAVVTATKQQPVFVAPPDSQRVRRVLHSHVYLRYIDNLYKRPEERSQTHDWHKLRTPKTDQPLDRQQMALARTWIDNTVPDDQVVSALHNLREHMMEHSTQIRTVLDPSQY